MRLVPRHKIGGKLDGYGLIEEITPEKELEQEITHLKSLILDTDGKREKTKMWISQNFIRKFLVQKMLEGNEQS